MGAEIMKSINELVFDVLREEGNFDKLPKGTLLVLSEGEVVFTNEEGDLEEVSQFIIGQDSTNSFFTERIE